MAFFFVDFLVDFLADFFFVDFFLVVDESDFLAFFLSDFFVDFFVDFLLLLSDFFAELFEVEDVELFEFEVEAVELFVPEDAELFFFVVELLDVLVFALVFVPFFRPLPEVMRCAVLSPTPFTRAIRSSVEENRPPRLRSSIIRWAITGPTPSTVCRVSRFALLTSSASAWVADNMSARTPAHRTRGRKRRAEKFKRTVNLQSSHCGNATILEQLGLLQRKKG